jgi:hypothetical protein
VHLLNDRATAGLAAGSLVVGFAVARLTGARELGGLVLVAAAALCAMRWRRAAGWPVTVGLLLLYLGAFVGSHVLARWVGAWPSVVIVAVVVGGASLVATGSAVPARAR